MASIPAAALPTWQAVGCATASAADAMKIASHAIPLVLSGAKMVRCSTKALRNICAPKPPVKPGKDGFFAPYTPLHSLSQVWEYVFDAQIVVEEEVVSSLLERIAALVPDAVSSVDMDEWPRKIACAIGVAYYGASYVVESCRFGSDSALVRLGAWWYGFELGNTHSAVRFLNVEVDIDLDGFVNFYIRSSGIWKRLRFRWCNDGRQWLVREDLVHKKLSRVEFPLCVARDLFSAESLKEITEWLRLGGKRTEGVAMAQLADSIMISGRAFADSASKKISRAMETLTPLCNRHLNVKFRMTCHDFASTILTALRVAYEWSRAKKCPGIPDLIGAIRASPTSVAQIAGKFAFDKHASALCQVVALSASQEELGFWNHEQPPARPSDKTDTWWRALSTWINELVAWRRHDQPFELS